MNEAKCDIMCIDVKDRLNLDDGDENNINCIDDYDGFIKEL